MKQFHKFIPISSLLFFVFSFSSCVKDQGKIDPPASMTACDSMHVTYALVIKPIFTTNCAISGCHVPGGSGNGDYTTYAGIKGKFDSGALNNRLFVQHNMPAAGPINADDLKRIKCWMDAQAPNN